MRWAPPEQKVGHLIVITGHMMSGKTEELIAYFRTVKRVEEIREQAAIRDGKHVHSRKIGVYKHMLDTRYSETDIVSHVGQRLAATPVQSSADLFKYVSESGHEIVFCDEVQFFMEKTAGEYMIISTLYELVERHCQVIVAGLDKDFRGMPFGPMGDILALADERISLSSVCARCGDPAVVSQRYIRGKPAHWSDPVLHPGSAESYEPRCRRCHEVSK
ncbi:thymidine kinase [Alicyclobacillus fastidiosus]|uniref:Thymidine kinase n=1 Tax=Alicyclobacillus fastidiosus TaxID=392011 RepID=A0ABY6ZLT2_9BACL|nr:thymidine kinase [Alicyclobacillus fastidiosus]WAH43812.1 thymidine kinase [Alicyclobacillus fastidiosus]GMA60042.1 thymidine kinase [Alicyclobacillus fastidiosus]